MTGKRKIAISSLVVVILGLAAGAFFLFTRARPGTRTVVLTGVVLADNPDPEKQIPMPNTDVTANAGWSSAARTKSDISGLFNLTLSIPPENTQSVTLSFRHYGYHPVDLADATGNQLYVVRLVSAAPPPAPAAAPAEPQSSLANVRVRYSIKAPITTNIGSFVKTFKIVNKGNVPCGGHQPCSPDGKWRATVGGLNETARGGGEFRNVRWSCIAGPCPFTKIQSQNLSEDTSNLKVSVLNWSDTATFLLEAEVSQTMIVDVIRQSYPVLVSSTMNFTLPASAEGPSVEAQLRGPGERNGLDIVFPLGPALKVSWGFCSLKIAPDKTKLYRCDLKPGYQFIK